jgi:hypothetical protein
MGAVREIEFHLTGAGRSAYRGQVAARHEIVGKAQPQ